MTDYSDGPGVPDADPDMINPPTDLADLFDSGDLELASDTDTDELREFIQAAEDGDLGPVDPELEAQVRIARSMLNDADEDDDD